MKPKTAVEGKWFRLGWQVLAVDGWVVADRLKGEKMAFYLGGDL